jgi:anhydro-N-acetylmuramic acid kinase
MTELFIGLISGTSMDGIDAALVDCSDEKPRLLDHLSHPIPAPLRQRIFQLAHNQNIDLNLLGETDAELGEVFADAANRLLQQAGQSAAGIRAIGCHGQTIWHNPGSRHKFTLQIGDANRITYRTGITTVADFRRKDMAAGGEGAPLAPALHRAIFSSDRENRGVLNIGGIANLSYLPASRDEHCFGFDCGPGNVLMDHWISQQQSLPFDRDGAWAASARASDELVSALMREDSYLAAPPPKSTGREHYHLQWLTEQLRPFSQLAPETIQASLAEFTAQSISQALRQHLANIETLIVCGGGTHNSHLMGLLQQHNPQLQVASSEQFGLHPDWVEAVAFAWLAKQALLGQVTDLRHITGARKNVVLGAIYPA